MSGNGDRKRVLVYSHDTYGLGHLRRSLLIAGRLASLPSPPSVLVATGSPRTQAFGLPQGCDTMKLPAVTKTPAGAYRARSLNLSLEEVLAIRADLLVATARSFRPDLVLVDHAPVGMEGELHPLLQEVSGWRRRPRLVLGLRDVIDAPDRVRDEWERLKAWPVITSLYDRVLVYGDPAVGTTAQDLGLPDLLGEKLATVGYLARPMPAGGRDGGTPTIVVTTGGGGDGQEVLRAYASFLEALPGRASFRSVIVTGPFLSRQRRREMEARFRAVQHPVEVLAFSERFEHLLASAAGVVSMAGYNTVVEILAAGLPALLLPREHPRTEQRIRAERLAAATGLKVCSPDRLGPEEIGRFVEEALGAPGRRPAVRLDGLERVGDELAVLLQASRAPRPGNGDRIDAVA